MGEEELKVQRSEKKPKALAKAYCHKHVMVANEIVAPPVIAVMASLMCGGKLFWATGGARCCHLDEFDVRRGLDIAMGRAASDIAMQLTEAGLSPWEADSEPGQLPKGMMGKKWLEGRLATIEEERSTKAAALIQGFKADEITGVQCCRMMRELNDWADRQEETTQEDARRAEAEFTAAEAEFRAGRD